MNVNDSRKGEGGDRKPGISAILTATQNPYSFTPRPIPLSLSPSPLPSAAGGRRRGRRLKPPPATAWKSCSCKKKKKKKKKEKPQLSLTQRGENGSFLQGRVWTPQQVRRVAAWGRCSLAPRQSRSRGAPHCVARSRGTWAGLPPPLRPSHPQPPGPHPPAVSTASGCGC